MNEIIYILINEAIPGYVKSARTKDLEQRIRELDRTNIPLPFECFYACTVANADFVEKLLHDAFMDHRTRSSREFFEISPDRVVSALKLAEIENVTPHRDFVETQEDQQALNQARAKRRDFNFEIANIPLGAELSFSRNQNIKARVIALKGANTIEVNGEIVSLSAAAKKILDCDYQVAGTLYWMYEGETLDERRRRIESQI